MQPKRDELKIATNVCQKWTAWTTMDEMTFIERLGTHKPKNLSAGPGRAALLKGYAEGVLQRERWGTISRWVILNSLIEKKVLTPNGRELAA